MKIYQNKNKPGKEETDMLFTIIPTITRIVVTNATRKILISLFMV